MTSRALSSLSLLPCSLVLSGNSALLAQFCTFPCNSRAKRTIFALQPATNWSVVLANSWRPTWAGPAGSVAMSMPGKALGTAHDMYSPATCTRCNGKDVLRYTGTSTLSCPGNLRLVLAPLLGHCLRRAPPTLHRSRYRAVAFGTNITHLPFVHWGGPWQLLARCSATTDPQRPLKRLPSSVARGKAYLVIAPR